ncbi:hypothetical protein MIPYR_10326 [uncultured Microbacterium sp.]|uniref:Uncharacterized protein n=1 Tax=uncultured Microbacterium sp. TaxID=191216 RepID=A0A1Y5NUW4_9MICO|nr:hypothetical protein MIPYR_10326 [uncultured Microbacterium sp.]
MSAHSQSSRSGHGPFEITSRELQPLGRQVLRGDPSHGARGAAQHDALGEEVVRAGAPHPGDEFAVRDARRDEDRVAALDEVVGLVDVVVELQTGIDAALLLLIVPRPQPSLDVPAERLDGARGDDALGAAADPDAHVGAGVEARRVDPAGDVAVAHQAGAGAGLADLVDERRVPRAIEHRHHELVDGLVERLREPADVLPDRQADVDDAHACRAGHELVHVEHRRRVEHRPAVGHGDDRERVVAALGGQRGPVDRVDGDVALRPASGTDVLAVEEHRRVVLLALADHDEPVEVHGGQERPHRVDGGTVGELLLAASDERDRADRRGLRGPDELESQVAVRMKRAHVCSQAHHVASLRPAPGPDEGFAAPEREGFAILSTAAGAQRGFARLPRSPGRPRFARVTVAHRTATQRPLEELTCPSQPPISTPRCWTAQRRAASPSPRSTPRARSRSTPSSRGSPRPDRTASSR